MAPARLNLTGTVIPSDVYPGTTYEVGRYIGTGAMAIAYLVTQCAPDGKSTVVMKVIRPEIAMSLGRLAMLSVKKEAVALGRLNEQVPCTPFVVRLLDTGNVVVNDGALDTDVPWVVLEYVHGGTEGTTLTERITKCVKDTGYAFAPDRAMRAISCITRGLTAVHEVGVIHRDVKPSNVLCCGSGADELFKIADFGVARPSGMQGTFVGDVIGTPGYAAPEAFLTNIAAGPWTDVFSVAGLVYFILTGQRYLSGSALRDIIGIGIDNARASVLECSLLSPALREREGACRAIDRALLRATSINPKERPQTVEDFAASLVSWLRSESTISNSLRPPKLAIAVTERPNAPTLPGWSWTTKHQGKVGMKVREVAWDSDGRCLAVSNGTLVYWDGNTWSNVTLPQSVPPNSVRLVHLLATNRWLVTFAEARIVEVSAGGAVDQVDLRDQLHRVDCFGGCLGDMAVFVDRDDANQLSLRCLIGTRWLKAIPLNDIAVIEAMARVQDAKWIFAGKKRSGLGVVGVYEPLDVQAELLLVPKTEAFHTCVGRFELEVGCAGGSDGITVWLDRSTCQIERVGPSCHLSSVALDASGVGWAAADNRIFRRSPADSRGPAVWISLLTNPQLKSPIVSLFADQTLVIAITAQGEVIEGRGTAVDQDTLVTPNQLIRNPIQEDDPTILSPR